MGNLRHFVTPLHQATKRDVLARMIDDKVTCMGIAKQYGFDYWDGDRRFGYGGYRYIPGRWKPVAEALIQTYALGPGSTVLDVGCGKGFLLHEMLLLEPGLQVKGFDISSYGIDHSTELVRPNLFIHDGRQPFPFEDKSFDLVISLGTLHNFKLYDLRSAVKEITRVGKNGYIMVESFRNDLELFNLQCWALTCESFLDVTQWQALYNELGYPGDFEFIFFT